eukprot:TRINITY_DN9867_c0_g1_i1.p1 TRINITY_DN9867_c0_g1~~TRINITY_DN9867_c0_g1_i1.p1  ORF type:complete len:251 (-),score=70.86 TRINITY_DN9867_c0_g1_i1:106-777(-)
MADIKYTYFDLRVKGEPARLLLAYSGLKYTDDRVPCPWDDAAPWEALKPALPWGQMPRLVWNGEVVCQSMSICRFLARECGIAGNTSLEMAQVDEIIDVVQDTILASYKAWYSGSKAELVTLTQKIFPTVLGQLEKRLQERGGQYMVGNNLTCADIHLFFLCTEDFLEKEVVAQYPLIANLVSRVGALPNIANWMQNRPDNGKEADGFKIYFKNAFKILKDDN